MATGIGSLAARAAELEHADRVVGHDFGYAVAADQVEGRFVIDRVDMNIGPRRAEGGHELLAEVVRC